MAKRGSVAEADEATVGEAAGGEPDEAGNGKPAKRPRSSEYLLEEWSLDDLPKRKGGNTGPRTSPLDKKIMEVVEAFPNGTVEGKAVMIARYGNGGQGGISAATVLRKRWASKDAGVKVFSRSLNDENERGLFVTYTPGDVAEA